EREKLRVRTVGLAVDAGGFSVSGTADLLRLAFGFGADLAELALHVAEDLLALAFALRAEAGGNRSEERRVGKGGSGGGGRAEDGIRDFHVTGVQTCALPI